MMSQIKSLAAGLLILCTSLVCAQTSPPKKAVSSPLEYRLSVPLNTPVGIDVDRYGRMYVLDAGRHTVMRFGLSGELECTWSSGMHEAQYAAGRRSMSVTPEGWLMLGKADYERNVKRFGASGEVILPLSEREDGTVICVSEDGSYVTTFKNMKRVEGKNDEVIATKVQKHDPDGKVTSTVSIPADVSIAIAPDGLIYSADPKIPIVKVYGFDGKVVRTIKLQTEKDGVYGALTDSMQIDSNGDIYFASCFNVARFGRNGKLLDSWSTVDGPCGATWYPGSSYRVRNGLIYILMNINVQTEIKGTVTTYAHETFSEIKLFTPDGECVARYVPKKPEINTPSSVAVGEDGNYILVEHGTDTIYFYGPEGRKTVTMPVENRMRPGLVVAKPGGGYFIGVIELDSKGNFVANHYERDPANYPFIDIPVQVTIDPTTKNIWALGGGGTLTSYSPEGKIQKRLGEKRELNFKTWAIGMAMDHQGYLYLPDPWKHHILKVDQTGNIVATIGKEGSGFGELKFPEGIVIDDKDRIYVADTDNCRIHVFSTDGTPIAVWGKPGMGNGELDRPFGLAIAPGNVLWITDTFNDRLVKLSLDDFWGEAKKEVAPPVVVEVPKPKPIPAPGLVTVEGIVVAGSDDFDDVVYLESPDRLWGTKVTLPKDKYVLRGRKVKATGTLELVERAAKHLKAGSVEVMDENATKIAPFGMSNIYVGDGYRSGNKKLDISNLGLLIRTWGKVISVDQSKRYFVINDGSYPQGKGLVVYAGNLRKPLIDWPVVDQYVCVTGISITWASTDGKYTAGLRVRCDEDIKVLE